MSKWSCFWTIVKAKHAKVIVFEKLNNVQTFSGTVGAFDVVNLNAIINLARLLL